MAKGQQKTGRSAKKPKQENKSGGKSAYATARDSKNVAATPFIKKK